MNKKVTVFALGIVALCALFAMAQEKPNPKEALRWYPDGSYSRFGLYETASLRGAEAYAVFKQMFSMSGDSVFGAKAPVPEEFLEKSDFFCFAKIVNAAELKAQQMLQAKIESEVKDKKRDEIDEEELERLGERMRQSYESDHMWVFNIPELDLLVESAVKNGSFARSGKKLLGRPLYSLSSKGGREDGASESNVYAWASAAGELLVADKPETIRDMVAAGEGGGMRMIDNQEYSEFLGYVSEFGNIWSVQSDRAEKTLSLERLRDSAADETKIKQLEEEIANNEIFDIQNFFVTDVIVLSSSKVFADEDIAKEKYADQTGSLRQAAAEVKKGKQAIPKEEAEKMSQRERRMVNKALGFAGNLLDSQQTTIDGTVVTTTITFGKQQLKTLGQLMTFAKMMEEKEQEEKEAAEEEKQ